MNHDPARFVNFSVNIPVHSVLTAMQATALAAALVAGWGLPLNVQAAPPVVASATAPDDMERLLADKGVIGQLTAATQSAAQNVSSKAGELVVSAMGFLGVPYKRGGNSFESGFDCSGFVKALYEQTVGKVLPRKAEQQAAATLQIDKSDLQPGDLVFFNTLKRAFSHVGIYVGEGKFIHSPKPGAAVRVEDMQKAYWNQRFDGARRVSTVSENP